MNQKLLNSALESNPQFSIPEYTRGETLNQLYGTQVVNQPPIAPVLEPYVNTNAQGILGIALKDMLRGNPQTNQNYLDMLRGNIGLNYGGYGLDIGFNQPHPNPWGLPHMGTGQIEDWNVNVKFPINL